MSKRSRIDSFDGRYEFLSNFDLVEVQFEREAYPSVEHAFQAAKTDYPSLRREIKGYAKPGTAKKLGRALDIRPEWERVKGKNHARTAEGKVLPARRLSES